MSHVDPDELIRYRIDRSLAGDPEGLEAHVQACPACAEELAAVDAEDDALADGGVWAIVDAMGAPRTARLQQALIVRKRMEQENEAARKRLAPLLSPSLRLTEAKIANRPALVHAGTVRFLCAAAQQLHEKRPLSALEVATEAYNVACVLRPDATTGRRLSMALTQRERANALRYLGRFRDALAALDEAEALFDSDPAADPFDIGVVNLIRAYLLWDSDRFEEAAGFAQKARRAFRDYPDASRELGATMVEAACMLELDDKLRAAHLFEEVAAIARQTGDTSMLARGLSNAGVAYMRSGELEKPEQYYVEALMLYDELGLTTETARTNWSFASLVLLRGELVEATKLLDASRTELASVGLANDSASATLEWAEARLALGMPTGVAAACRAIIVTFDSQGMVRRARIALAHLQEALETGTATPQTARRVRDYIEQLPRHPDRSFVPA